MNAKTILAIVATILTLFVTVGGIIWAAEDRYMDEGESVQTVQQMQQVLVKQQSVLEKRLDTLERKDLMQEYTFLTEQYFIWQARVAKSPGNREIFDEFKRVQLKLDGVKKKLGL